MSTTTNRSSYEIGTTTVPMQLDQVALSGAAALVSAAVMLVLGVFGAVGIYAGAVEATVVGTVAGMVTQPSSASLVYALGWLYSALAG